MPGYNGTLVGGPNVASSAASYSTSNNAANFSEAIDLNGSTQRVDLPVAALQFVLNASWAIRGRFRTTNSSGIHVIVSYGQTSGTPSDDIWIGTSGGVLQASVKNVGLLGTISVADGNWHTFEYDYVGSTKTGLLFVDGVISGAQTVASPYPGSAGNANALSCIGAFAAGSAPSFYWDDQLDEIAIYDTALHTTTATFTEATTPTSNSAANLRALYHFDGNANDSSTTVAPTSATLTGPSSGTTGSASSNFTITLDAAALGTINFTPAGTVGSVTFTPGTPQITAGQSSVTFTANAASDGTHVITITNDGGLTNIGSVNYTTAATNTIPVTDTNYTFSPYNWNKESGWATAVNGGAYFRIGFTGTKCEPAIDVSSLVTAGISAGEYPSLIYSVDNGALTSVQLSSATTKLSITGLSAGNHTLQVWYKNGMWESSGIDRWTTPAYCIKVGAATIDAAAASAATTGRPGNMIIFGDSIPEGIRIENSTVQPGCQNGYLSFGLALGAAFDCEVGMCCFGGQAFTAGFGSVPAFSSAYSFYYNGKSRLVAGVLSPAPDHVVVCLGTNGSPSSSDVQTAITNMRTIAPAADIWIVMPFGQFNASAIAAGVSAYGVANPSDTTVKLINLGSSWSTGLSSFGAATQQAVDGLHPTAAWHARLGTALAQAIQEKIGGGGGGTTVDLSQDSLDAIVEAVSTSAIVAANVKYVNDIAIAGAGVAGVNPWRPA